MALQEKSLPHLCGLREDAENGRWWSNVEERSACGVGFAASLTQEYSHDILSRSLDALSCVEHRGACSADQITGDGSGVMTDIPFELLGYERGSIAVAMLFTPPEPELNDISLRVFEETFSFYGIEVLEYREVPINREVLGPSALENLPVMKQAIIKRPAYCRTDYSFNKLLHDCKQVRRTKEKQAGVVRQFYFTSLSTSTIVYKALVKAGDLGEFYPDLKNPAYTTRFVVFHRRFSTNTRTTWDKAQPFRMIGHNGEINTISGNRSWSYSREQALGLPVDELLTHVGMSDSGNLNEMVEALKYRSSIPYLGDILRIMIPPAELPDDFAKLWSRAVEPWDGPAFITFCDGETVGARLDRNGFRPCRWALTGDRFYLASEAGVYALPENEIVRKGTLHAGAGVSVTLKTGELYIEDPGNPDEYRDAGFDLRLLSLESKEVDDSQNLLEKKSVFGYTHEDLTTVLIPMMTDGKEPIGSMGDTARPAFLSDESRPFFDYFYQHFAQVTNPPVDYIRERIVTDLSMYLGRIPNVFSTKELIPPFLGIELKSPLLELGEMEALSEFESNNPDRKTVAARRLEMTFPRSGGAPGFQERIKELCQQALEYVERRISVLILSDRSADYDNPPIPSVLLLSAILKKLDAEGRRLRASIVVDSGEVRSTHHLAALVGFGATAVCPYLALQVARWESHRSLDKLIPDQKTENLIKAYKTGLLRIMSKMGISVARSYQGSRLFTAFGLGEDVVDTYFSGIQSPIGGLPLEKLVANILSSSRNPELDKKGKLPNTYQFKEHSKGKVGEKHSMTVTRARLIHELVRGEDTDESRADVYSRYLDFCEQNKPVNIRHLWSLKYSAAPLPLTDVQPREEITAAFGSGAMSFGAISAESQRDIFHAMSDLGGRSNSGEGGENPYYWIDGTTASIKQIASGRFGVTAQYAITSKELQIKIAQGAKPLSGASLKRDFRKYLFGLQRCPRFICSYPTFLNRPKM